MRRVLSAGALCLILGSGLSAATVISGCTLDGSPTTCYTSGTFSFADSVDWGAAVNLAGTGQSGFGPAFQNAGNPRDVSILPWNARSVGNVTIFASLDSGTQVLTRADNTFWGFGPVLTSGGLVNQYAPIDNFTGGQHLITFAGRFNTNPTNLDPTMVGEHLLGDISGGGPLILSFNRNISQIGFNIASNSTSSDTNFAAAITGYFGSTALHTYTINVTGGGGICDSLQSRVGVIQANITPPVPCNDAAFIAIDAGPQRFTSIQVSTLPGGFFINGLRFNADSVEVPEPGITLLMAGGLAGLWLFSIARRRFASNR